MLPEPPDNVVNDPPCNNDSPEADSKSEEVSHESTMFRIS